jgi:hypothetical protein
MGVWTSIFRLVPLRLAMPIPTNVIFTLTDERLIYDVPFFLGASICLSSTIQVTHHLGISLQWILYTPQRSIRLYNLIVTDFVSESQEEHNGNGNQEGQTNFRGIKPVIPHSVVI